MSDSESLSFSERLKQRQAERGELAPPSLPVQPSQPEHKFDDDLIPDIADTRSETDIEVDKTLDGIGILKAYQTWVNKEIDWSTRGRKDGFMVSCPKPNHRDSHPSAWINEDEGVWFCGTCQECGDMFDMAAYYHNFDVPGYKDGQSFHRLREAMAEDFGLHIKRMANNEEVVWRDAPADTPSTPVAVAPPPIPTATPLQVPPDGRSDVLHTSTDTSDTVLPVSDISTSDQPENVVEIPVVPENYSEPIEKIDYPTLDWRSIVKEDTFLYEYMVACCTDDSPEEYHFWNGMLALGHAVGRRVTLRDRPAVVPNLMLCMLGGTGIGKSKSRSYLTRLLREVFPFDGSGPLATGVKVVAVPGSGEFLIKSFSHEYSDPSLGKGAPIQRSPINGLVDFDEFAAMLARANRQGSTLKTAIMQMGDAAHKVSLGSLTHGEYHADEPFCSITASTQPRAIRTLVSKADAGSGFLNRWMFVSGAAKEKVVFGSSEIDLSRAIDRYKEIKGWGAIDRHVEIDPAALPDILDFFQSIIYPARENDDTDLLARTDLIMKKMMLLLTINNRETTVSPDTFKRVKPIYGYLVKCYGLIHEEIGITLMHEVGDDITRVLRNHEKKYGRGATPRDLQRSLARKKYTPQQIKQTLDNLVALDWVEVIKPKAGSVGAPAVRYLLTGEK